MTVVNFVVSRRRGQIVDSFVGRNLAPCALLALYGVDGRSKLARADARRRSRRIAVRLGGGFNSVGSSS
jgi:hypothetical protein